MKLLLFALLAAAALGQPADAMSYTICAEGGGVCLDGAGTFTGVAYNVNQKNSAARPTSRWQIKPQSIFGTDHIDYTICSPETDICMNGYGGVTKNNPIKMHGTRAYNGASASGNGRWAITLIPGETDLYTICARGEGTCA